MVRLIDTLLQIGDLAYPVAIVWLCCLVLYVLWVCHIGETWRHRQDRYSW
jgi:hypothetical protein